MSVLLQAPEDARRYITDQAHRRTLWGFQHIPKTAGSSVIDLLQIHLSPYRNIFPKTYDAAPADFRALMAESVREFLELQGRLLEAEKFRSFSGHFFPNHLDVIREAIPDVRLFTLLRDPVARAISDYRYCLTPTHPTHAEFARTYPTLHHYVADKRLQNVMTKRLAPIDRALYWSAQPLDPGVLVSKILSYYTFIGTQEHYAESIEIAMAMMGVTDPASPKRINVTPETAANRIEIDATIIEEIRSANPLDSALYDEVSRRLAPRITVWRAHS